MLFNGKDIGFIGELYFMLVVNNDLKCMYVFEFNYDVMMEVFVGYINYEFIFRFLGVICDIVLEVNYEVILFELLFIIYENGEDILNDIFVFDVYEGEYLEKGKKFIVIRFSYLDIENIFIDECVNVVYDKILEVFKKYGVIIR